MKKKKYYAISIIIVLLILIITIITTKLTINKELLIDKYAYELIVLKLRNDTLTPIMKFITKLSNTSIIILIAILLTIIISLRKNIKTASLIPINLGIIAIINQILKKVCLKIKI